MAQIVPVSLAATGSTGNNTHTGTHVGAEADAIEFRFIVEAAGATPTVTFKVQGTNDDTSVSDANAVWTDIMYLPAGSDTGASATQTATAVGATVFFHDTPSGVRFYRRFRLVTSANTNITYRCEARVLQARQ